MSKKPGPRKRSRATASKGPTKPAGRGYLSVMRSAERSVAERTKAVSAVSPATAGDPELTALMAVLTDKTAPSPVRLAALQSLGAARFASPAFAASQGDYIAALRKVVDDPDLELRQRVLGILAREKDPYAQKRLLDGLKDPTKALVSPEKALQLLSYDVHADAYPVARQIVQNPPNQDAKREALRLLAADAESAPMFERILRDKSESAEIREVGAAALHALRPDSLQAHARDIVMDPSEPDDIQRTSLTALTQFGPSQVGEDQALMNRVDELSTRGSATVQDSARKLRAKYRR